MAKVQGERAVDEAEAAYSQARGRAMSASTRRLRWRARRIPQHTIDQLLAAERRAVLDELRDRGVVGP